MLQNAGNVENASCVNLFPIDVDETIHVVLQNFGNVENALWNYSVLQTAGNIENALCGNLFPIDDETILCCRTLAMLKMLPGQFVCKSC